MWLLLQGMSYVVNILRFIGIEFFVFQSKAFHFSKLHEFVVKLDKGNLKRLERDIQGEKSLKLLERLA